MSEAKRSEAIYREGRADAGASDRATPDAAFPSLLDYTPTDPAARTVYLRELREYHAWVAKVYGR